MKTPAAELFPYSLTGYSDETYDADDDRIE